MRSIFLNETFRPERVALGAWPWTGISLSAAHSSALESDCRSSKVAAASWASVSEGTASVAASRLPTLVNVTSISCTHVPAFRSGRLLVRMRPERLLARVKSRRTPPEPGAAGSRLGLDRDNLLGESGVLVAVDQCILAPKSEANSGEDSVVWTVDAVDNLLELGARDIWFWSYNGLKFPDEVRSKTLLGLGALSAPGVWLHAGVKFPDDVRSKRFRVPSESGQVPDCGISSFVAVSWSAPASAAASAAASLPDLADIGNSFLAAGGVYERTVPGASGNRSVAPIQTEKVTIS